jgi:hypothetical protein
MLDEGRVQAKEYEFSEDDMLGDWPGEIALPSSALRDTSIRAKKIDAEIVGLRRRDRVHSQNCTTLPRDRDPKVNCYC